MKIKHADGHKYWIGLEIHCFRCGTIFELEASDQPKLTTERAIVDHNRTIIGHLFSTTCPTCQGIIYINSADKEPIKQSVEMLPAGP